MSNNGKIDRFVEEFRFLSNFYPAPVKLDGVTYPSVEHAYQAAKTLDHDLRKPFLTGTAGQAKRRGRKLKLRRDWEKVKINVMHNLVKQKFQDEHLGTMLLDTEDYYLEEGNNHGDMFWGTVDGIGENHLGKVLMKVRSEL